MVNDELELLENILIEIEDAHYPFHNPVLVLFELEVDKEPMGVATFKKEGDALYADITIRKNTSYLHLYPTIAFSKITQMIQAISLSETPNSDKRIMKIEDQLKVNM